MLVDAALLGEFVSHAHNAGMEVVAWYLPSVVDVDADYTMIQRIAAFRVDGEGFDGVALDLEDTQSVPDVAVRNDRIVDLTKRTRKLLGKSRALGAIVYPAVQTELINPVLWPTFPYRRLEPSVDVWMPMAYFTFRDVESGYRDPLRYTEDSVDLLRAHLAGQGRARARDRRDRRSRDPRGLRGVSHGGAPHEGGRLLDVRLPHDVVGRVDLPPTGRRREVSVFDRRGDGVGEQVGLPERRIRRDLLGRGGEAHAHELVGGDRTRGRPPWLRRAGTCPADASGSSPTSRGRRCPTRSPRTLRRGVR